MKNVIPTLPVVALSTIKRSFFSRLLFSVFLTCLALCQGGKANAQVISVVAGNGIYASGYSGDGGPATAAEIAIPSGVAFDHAGNMYIGDPGNRAIRKVNSAGIISTYAGTGYPATSVTEGGVATATDISLPNCIAVDASGNVYFIDQTFSVVRRISTSGILNTFAGSVSRAGSYTGDGGPATNAGLYRPYGIAFDGAGNLYIGDAGNNVIRMVSTSGIINTVAGNGTSGFSGDGGPATAASLNSPFVTVDSIGNIYIAVTGRIRKVNRSGIISTIAGNGVVGFPVDGGMATAGELVYQNIVADNNGNLFLGADVIQKIDTSGRIYTIAYSPVSSLGTTINIDSHDNLYVSNVESNTIIKIDSGMCMPPLPEPITGSSAICLGSVAYYYPTAYFYEFGPGTISLTTSNSLVATIDSAGMLTTHSVGLDTIILTRTSVCGTSVAIMPVSIDTSMPHIGPITGSTSVYTHSSITLSDSVAGGTWLMYGGYSADDGMASVDSVGNVTGETVGTDSVWYVVSTGCGADTATFGITITGPAAAACDVISTYASNGSTGTTGRHPIITYSGADSTVSDFEQVKSLTFDRSGNLYFADNVAAVIYKITPADTASIIAGTFEDYFGYSGYDSAATATSFVNIGILTVDDSGNVYFYDEDDGIIRKINTSGRLSRFASGCTSCSGFGGDGGPATDAQIGVLNGIATDHAGNVYTAEASFNVIRKIDGITGTITTLAGNGYRPEGGFSGDGGPATAALLDVPYGLAVDGAGNIYFADSRNSRIRKINTSGIISTIAGNGTPGFSGDGGAATDAELNNPQGITVDLAGNIYITDHDNFRVRVVNTSGIISTVAGSGAITTSTIYSGDGGMATDAKLNGPQCVAIDSAGNIFVGDGSRIAKINNSHPTDFTISGAASVCTGSTDTLSVPVPGGTWSSSNTSIASVSTAGVVSGIANGIDTISYSISGICGTGVVTKVINVSPSIVVGAISGHTSLVAGSTTTLTDTTAGGSWSSSDTTLATISSSGVLSGIAAGVVTISYSVTGSCGAAVATYTDTVIALPMCAGTPAAGHITASTYSSCSAFSTTLTVSGYTTASGITFQWQSSVDSTTWSNISGATNATYSASVSSTTYYRIVVTCSAGGASSHSAGVALRIGAATVGSISGTSSVCAGSAITLSDTTSGGTWSSSNTSIATVSSSGIVSGVVSGIDTISYTSTGSCGTVVTTKVITVQSMPTAGTITGRDSICPGASITLSDTSTGGSWTSSDTSVATVNSTAGLVSGVSAGTVIISYTKTTACGSGSATTTVTINPLPIAAPISGPSTVCVGSVDTLSDTASGGSWSTSSSSIATISGGRVGGVSAGSATIYYIVSNSCGSDTATKSVTVNPLPDAGSITGTTSVCAGSTTTLADGTGTSGGSWSSSATSIATVGSTGIVSAVSAGTATISYSVTNSCGTSSATATVTVNPLPVAAPISGSSTVCVGSVDTLSDTTSGGSWSSGSSGIATVSGGRVGGVSAGSATIFYIVSNSCGSDTATKSVTVSPLPDAGSITGTTTVCEGSTTTLADGTGASGGSWSSGSSGIATVGTTGIVSGVSAGTATISYSVTNSCGTSSATATVTVNPLPVSGTITGPSTVCVGSVDTLSDTTSGGSWSTSSSSIATVGSTGIVSGVSAGSAVITYTVTTGCGTSHTTHSVTVTGLPSAGSISGTDTICAGITSTLTDATSGGTWSSSSTSIATISSAGVVHGVAAGSTIISYTVSGTCGSVSATFAMVIKPLPVAGTISGVSTMCIGASTTLTASITGGTWSSGSAFIATVSGGVVTGIAGGSANIFYTITNSCGTATATDSVTVYAPAVTATSYRSCGEYDTLVGTGITGATYTWAGSGLSCTSCDTTVVHVFGTTTYTVSATDSHSCPAHATITINGNRIMGHISFASTTPDTLDTKVWLIKFNPADSSLVALDSITSCMDGGAPYYEFDGIAAGNYMVKAKLIYGNTPGASGYIPTYSYTTQYWDSAATAPHTTNTDSLHIVMLYGTVPTGPGFISGYVYSGAGRGTTGDVPVNGMIVYLRNAGTNVLTYTYTNVLGYYSFSGLAEGTYDIYPSDFDYYTTPSATISLTTSSETVNNVDFKQHTTLGTITPFNPAIVPQIQNTATVNVFPNPTTGNLNIEWAGQTTGQATIRITDVTGREAFRNSWDITASSGSFPVNVSDLASGVYFINIHSESISYTGKIIVAMR